MSDWRWDQQVDFQIEKEIVNLKAYAVNTRDGLHGKEIAHNELVAALVKDQTETFEPIREKRETITFEVPANWLEHLKQSLPKDLQFG